MSLLIALLCVLWWPLLALLSALVAIGARALADLLGWTR